MELLLSDLAVKVLIHILETAKRGFADVYFSVEMDSCLNVLECSTAFRTFLRVDVDEGNQTKFAGLLGTNSIISACSMSNCQQNKKLF